MRNAAAYNDRLKARPRVNMSTKMARMIATMLDGESDPREALKFPMSDPQVYGEIVDG